jgi:hypothetical protein
MRWRNGLMVVVMGLSSVIKVFETPMIGDTAPQRYR